MAKFRSKSKIVEAYQVTDELVRSHLLDDVPFPKGLHVSYVSYHKLDRKINGFSGYVTTIHGEDAKVQAGDWIITEPDNIHHYPCKAEIFAKDYEPVEDSSNVIAKPDEVKATYIEIHWSDGSKKRASGEDAAKIWQWLESGETMNFIHGARYTGPKLEDFNDG